MECPYCGEELKWEDYYGKFKKGNYWTPIYIDKVGDIYICENEKCEYYQEHFYTDPNGYLQEGYPC